MSDRPSATNGKRSRAWGTRGTCPACGGCLCFGCHPEGPCVDDAAGGADGAGRAASRRGPAFGGAWLDDGTMARSGVSIPRLSDGPAAGARL